MLRSGLSPRLNAIGSLVFLVSVAVVLILELLCLPEAPRMTAPVTLTGLNHWFGTFHALNDIELTSRRANT